MAKYQAEIRELFISVFATDHFYKDVDPDQAISMILTEMNQSYEGMSTDLDIGLANGIPIEDHLQMFGIALGYWIEIG